LTVELTFVGETGLNSSKSNLITMTQPSHTHAHTLTHTHTRARAQLIAESEELFELSSKVLL